jgi:hypothetical protein
LIGQNPIGREMAWDYINENWNSLFSRYKSDPFSMSAMINTVLGSTNTHFDLGKIQLFIEKHSQSKLGKFVNNFNELVDIIKANIFWIQRNSDSIYQFLKEQTLYIQDYE